MITLDDIDAVTFDLDGTLYDLKAIGFRFFLANWRRMRVARVGKAAREELRAREFPTGQALLDEEARIVGERLDVDAGRARTMLTEVFVDSLARVIASQRSAPLHDAIDALAKSGKKIALISDRVVDVKLNALHLGGLPWSAKVSGDESGVLKPSPKPFLLACERMGSAPARTLHIGDRDDTDGVGARAAGLRFQLVSGPEELTRLLSR